MILGRQSIGCFLALASALWAHTASAAVTDINFTNVTGLTSANAQEIMKVVAFGCDHRAYMPASSLGMKLGLDVGVDFTLVTLPQGFINAMTSIGASATNLPNPLPIPKINIHKGLPQRFDLGFTWFGLSSGVTTAGAEVKWTAFEGARYPALATRLSYTYNLINFIVGRTLTWDLIVSKSIGFMFEPYAGVGYQFANGELVVPAAQLAAANFASTASFSAPHYYLGLAINLFVLKITAEYTSTVGSTNSYGFKASLAL